MREYATPAAFRAAVEATLREPARRLKVERVDDTLLKSAIGRVFDPRATHAVPERLPPPPPELAVSYRREAEQVGVAPSVQEAHEVLRAWLDPVLA